MLRRLLRWIFQRLEAPKSVAVRMAAVCDDGTTGEVSLALSRSFHACDLCGSAITPGQRYVNVRLDGFGRDRVCADCIDTIRDMKGGA